MIFNRPWLIWILIVLLVFFSVFQWVRFGEALANWGFINSLHLVASPLYLALTGLGWGLFGSATILWLWRGLRRGRQAAGILTVTFVLYYWFEQLVLMDSPLRKTNWGFIAVVTVVLTGLVFLILQAGPVREFCGEVHDQKEQD